MLLKELLEKILETNATGNSKVVFDTYNKIDIVYDQEKDSLFVLGSCELIQDEVL